MKMIPASTNEYQVYESQTKLCIDLKQGHCSCSEWIMTRIPYQYVMTCVHYKRIELGDICSSYYII
jgi:hypothetical protein